MLLIKSAIGLSLFASAAFCQTLNFETASVKPATGTARGRMQGGPGTSDPGQIVFTNVTLYSVLLRAYGIQTFELSTPDWLSSRKYDILAKVPPGTTKDQCN